MKLFKKDRVSTLTPKEHNTEEFVEEVKATVKKYGLSNDTAYRWLRNNKIPSQYQQNNAYLIGGKTLREFRKKSLKLTVKEVCFLYQLHNNRKLSPVTLHMYESGYIPTKRATNKFWLLVEFYKFKSRSTI